jgi:hydrogenase nickel incorporation protein HypB
MCGICGCGEPNLPAGLAHSGSEAGSEVNGQAKAYAHEARRVAVEESIVAHNDRHAAALRARLEARGIDAVGLVGGPGSGKTTLMAATLRALGPAARHDAVIEGDCATDLDARRLQGLGARVVQVETGSLCHLDAHHVEHALDGLDLDGVTRLWIENVGNLVCPAAFACGERRRVVLVSTPEGDEKPLKYPALFASADLLLITKVDLLPHVDFDTDACVRAAQHVRSGLPALVVSARTGEGLSGWLAWIVQGRA